MPDQFITILIADDHPVVRDGLRRILETEPDFKVVAEAGNGIEATDLARQLKPDVLLLDIFMPEASGFDVLRQLQGTDTRFLILTAGGNRNELLEAVRLQAHGVLTKDAPVEVLLKAIRKIAAGEYWIDRELLAKAVRPADQATPKFGLTGREMEIVNEICAGASNKDIANKLNISDLTVKRHLTNIFDKTGVSSRLELALFAIAHKLQVEA
jgi:DNA-binding NarL/FixJ family response regulator